MPDPLPLFSLSRAIASNTIWGTCVQRNEISLSRHRAASERKIQKLNLPISILSSLEQGLTFLEQAYNHAFHWFRIYSEKIPSLKDFKVDIHNGKYCLSKFITPLGEFNEINWVIQFVDDKTQDIFDRFCFASYYCLERKIPLLWTEIENNLHIKNDLIKYSERKNGIIRAWINFQRIPTYFLDYAYYETFFFDYFFSSCYEGNDKAACYIWDKFSISLRRILLSDYDLVAHLMYRSAFYGYPKCVYLVYNSLNHSQQLRYLQNNYEVLPNISVWQYFLKPVLLQFIPDQISLHQCSLPSFTFSEFLHHLSCKVTEINSTAYKELFYTVWNLGSVENKSYFLQNDQNVLLNLCVARDFASVKCILKDASQKQRRRFLLESTERLLFRDSSFRNDCMAIRNYLLLFITDYQKMNTLCSEISFHADSLALLEDIQIRYERYLDFSCAIASLISEISNSFKLSNQKASDLSTAS